MDLSIKTIGALTFCVGAFSFGLFILGMIAFKKPKASLLDIWMNNLLMYSHLDSYIEEKYIPKLKIFYKVGAVLIITGMLLLFIGILANI